MRRGVVSVVPAVCAAVRMGRSRRTSSSGEICVGVCHGWPPGPERTSALLEAIAAVTPDGERFDAPESTFVQDVAICMDAAVRSSDQTEEINPGWVEYVVEPATVAASEEQTGYLDAGDSIEAEEWRATALRHSGLRRAFETSAELLRVLAMKPSLSSSDVAELRPLAAGLLVSTQ